ncbi:hypothetical protein [Parapedobacter tibetensis]|uniref:hypothetical protein n=1 Tax=Parapedobacter tibetensis TaxID=2972951 RepID=UPI00214DBF7D|nr:hypothetical protein [Parapedobacter tibetensis]
MNGSILKVWLLRVTLICLLSNAFLVSTKLPDGLFTAKELGLYFSVSIASLCAAVSLFLPGVHLLVFESVSLPAVPVQTAYGMAR